MRQKLYAMGTVLIKNNTNGIVHVRVTKTADRGKEASSTPESGAAQSISGGARPCPSKNFRSSSTISGDKSRLRPPLRFALIYYSLHDRDIPRFPTWYPRTMCCISSPEGLIADRNSDQSWIMISKEDVRNFVQISAVF